MEERLGEPAREDDLATRVALARMLASTFGRVDGVRIGRYTLLRRLGAGGMGEVWAAEDAELGRTVAIKLLPPGFPRSRCVEGRALARLNHPGAVEVFEIGEADGRVFVVMELVDGVTLRDWLATPHGWREIVDVLVRIGEALADSHAAGLVHRDIKPDNVMLTRDGAIKLVDFGVALVDDTVATSQPPQDSGEPRDSAETPPSTSTGAITGTLGYMAPEQLRGLPATAKSDQFALCVLGWYALTGRLPFAGDTLDERIAAIERGPADALPRECPRAIDRTLRRGLSAAADDRWPDVRALLAALAPATRSRLPVVLLGVAALGVLAATLVPSRSSCESQATARVEVTLAGVDEPALQRYGDAWKATYVEVCTDPHADRFDAAMACLDEGLRSAAALRELVSSERVSAEKGATAALRLPAAASCTEAPERSGDHPPPEQREAYLAAQRGFAEVSALELARDMKQAEVAIDRVRALLATIDAPSLAARVELESAILRLEVQDHRGAIERLERALASAEKGADDPAFARSATLLMRTYGAELRDDEASDRYLRLADAAMARFEPNGDTRRIYATARALVLERRGDYEGAIVHQREAVETGGARPFDDSRMRITLAVLLSRAGHHEEAIAQARRANAEQREILGPDHREMVLTTANVGAVEAMGGELAAAEQTFTDGLRIARREFGDRHPVTSTLWHNLGEVAVDRGDPAAGVPKLVEALAIRKEAYPPGHHARRETFVTLVRAQRAAGATDDAIGSLRELATELESAPSVDSAELAQVLVDLAELEQQRGHATEAMAALRRAGPRLEDPGTDPALVRRAAALREAADERDDSR